MMSGLVPAIPFPSAQSEPLTVEGIMKQLNRPRGDRMIVPGKILEDVHDSIIENKKGRRHILKMLEKRKKTLPKQRRLPGVFSGIVQLVGVGEGKEKRSSSFVERIKCSMVQLIPLEHVQFQNFRSEIDKQERKRESM
ncbi:hypothetical protein CRE_21670 [Caenorhabditis remanei]|uniref:Uncharacterized protein n=1 Tax=Caenorhabditis remanei TaxID=31234 RepID=E3NS94_CAERE|nr:hypothetical protein CRE_21670 [Caenorhabditis remanei]